MRPCITLTLAVEETAMEKFVHQKNLAHYRKLLAGATPEPQRRQILALLAEEESKEPLPPGHEVGGLVGGEP